MPGTPNIAPLRGAVGGILLDLQLFTPAPYPKLTLNKELPESSLFEQYLGLYLNIDS